MDKTIFGSKVLGNPAPMILVLPVGRILIQLQDSGYSDSKQDYGDIS